MSDVQNRSDVTKRLEDLKQRVEKGKTEKARAEANLENYTKQKEELEQQLRDEHGIEPDQLEGEISNLDQEITENLQQAEELLGGGA